MIRFTIALILCFATISYACEECDQLGHPHIEHIPDFTQDSDAIIVEAGQKITKGTALATAAGLL